MREDSELTENICIYRERERERDLRENGRGPRVNEKKRGELIRNEG